MKTNKTLLATLLSTLLLGACAGSPEKPARVGSTPDASEYAPEPDENDDILTSHSGVRFIEVKETFITAATPEDNVDSPASWQTPAGDTWLIATGKASDQLLVYSGDNGELLRRIAGSGVAAGQLERPNGIFVVDDAVFVVERDNQRVQAFSLPDFAPLGSFGESELQKPYGLWLMKRDAGYEVLVSDAYMDPSDEDLVPALANLDQRFKRYGLRINGGRLEADFLGSFGDTSEAGAIRVPESIWGDPQNGRLLISEEDQPTGTRLRVYDMDYRYAGKDVGATLFHAQAEGMALWACDNGSGYWIATDQYKDRSVFHVFDRASLAHVGAFAGAKTANTDGVWLQQSATMAFPNGVFYAVDDDQAVAAFDWRDIASALDIRVSCN